LTRLDDATPLAAPTCDCANASQDQVTCTCGPTCPCDPGCACSPGCSCGRWHAHGPGRS